jgi:predicted esterase YcpF (UPF0227 family)
MILLYLHGFRSSPGSIKASMLRDALAACGKDVEYVCPQLPASPRAAVDLVLARVAGVEPHRLCLIGSSLGGYYATWVAERVGCAAVLLNPAVRPYDDLKSYLGIQPVFFSDATIDVRPAYIEELVVLDTPRITAPERYFLVAATGDEVIDYREMAAKYAGCRQRIIAGSDHSISDFAGYLDEVLAFCFDLTGDGR